MSTTDEHPPGPEQDSPTKVVAFEPGRPTTRKRVETTLLKAGLRNLTPESSSEEIGAFLSKAATLCRKANEIDRETIRRGAVDALKNLNISSPVRWVDAAFKSQVAEATTPLESVVAETVPWEKPVDGAELLSEITAIFSRFLMLPPGGAEILALWALHTHSFDASFHTPYLCINSPTKGCGKTTALDILGQLSCKSLATSNITGPAVFRTVDIYQPTFLVDEADTFLGLSDDLRGILNSGNRKNTAHVIRLERSGDDYHPRKFSTWCPKAFALIGRLPPTLEDRSIVVTMHRKTSQDAVEELDFAEVTGTLREYRRKMARWVQDHFASIQDAAPEIPAEYFNRGRDKFRPLFAIAYVIGGVWPDRISKAALSISGMRNQEEEIGVQLLTDIRELILEHDWEKGISSHQLANLLGEELPKDRPWATFNRGSGITQRQLANLLSPFEIRPTQLWIDRKKVRGYEINDFKDAFRRYLPPLEVVGPVEPSNDGPLSGSEEAVGPPLPTGSEDAVTDCKQVVLPDLPDRTTHEPSPETVGEDDE